MKLQLEDKEDLYLKSTRIHNENTLFLRTLFQGKTMQHSWLLATAYKQRVRVYIDTSIKEHMLVIGDSEISLMNWKLLFDSKDLQ